MAALLRSARLLKFSPSGSLQITGTSRSGPPLSRLFSRVLCGSRNGVRPRQITPGSENALSRVWPCTVGCVRTYTNATEQKDETSVVESKQAEMFDKALSLLDNSAKRTGRITRTLLLRVFQDICRTDYPSSNHALLLLRSCGSLLSEVPLEERTELAHRMWNKLKEMGVRYDVSHYNALLKVYLQNEFKFSPTEFLAKLEANDVQPNRVTYERLMEAYCDSGDIEGASKILNFIKSKDMPITERVFNSLVTGHARAGDMESAKNILSVMTEAGILPGPDTYLMLLNAHAERGDIDSLKETLQTANDKNYLMKHKDTMQVILSLAKAGHQQHVPEMMTYMKPERGYRTDTTSLCLTLLSQGLEDAAFQVLKTCSYFQYHAGSGNFFLRHCIHMDVSLEKLVFYCKELNELNLCSTPLTFSLSCALSAKKTEMSLKLMKLMQEQNLPIRPHYFWPLFPKAVDDEAGVIKVLSAMQELRVSPDIDTVENYVVPVFKTLEKVQQALKDSGVSLTLETLLVPVVRRAAGNLGKLHSILSDPSFPAEHEVKTQEATLRKYLQQLHALNITIHANIYRGIRNILLSYNVPKLTQDVLALVDPNDPNSKGLSIPQGLVTETPAELEKRLELLKRDKKPFSILLRLLLDAVLAEDNLQRALELKTMHKEEMTAICYIVLISACCRLNNTEEALNLKRELNEKKSLLWLDSNKYMELVKVLSSNGQVEEAIDLLKEMKEREVTLDNNVSLFHLLNAIALTGDAATVKRLLDTIFSLGLTKPKSNLCSNLVIAHLKSGDVGAAMQASMDFMKDYGLLTGIHDLMIHLLENRDTEELQNAMDFVNESRGELAMLYNLFFALLDTGRITEARKIIETPGMRAKDTRLQWYAEKCIANNEMEPLEQMVDLTRKLFDCDRDEMYFYVLRLCQKRQNWQKATSVWTKMQEESLIPRDRTLHLLAGILRSNGQEVPFEMSKSRYLRDEEISASNRPTKDRVHQYMSRIFSLIKKQDKQEAYEMVQQAKDMGYYLTAQTYNVVIRALLAGGSYDNAMRVKDIAESMIPGFKLQDRALNLLIITQSKKGQTQDALETLKSVLSKNIMPSLLATSALVQAQAKDGDEEGIQEVVQLVAENGLSKNLPTALVDSSIILARFKSGNGAAAVELLEEVLTNPDIKHNDVFPLFAKILDLNDEEAFDKLNVLVERQANHFADYKPVTILFLKLLENYRVDEAKLILDRCSAVAEQKDLLEYFIVHKTYVPGQVDKIKSLMSLIPDFADKMWLSANLMKCHYVDNDLTSAKVLYNQMQEEGTPVDDLSLKRLAVLYKNAGEDLPFTEPTVSPTKTNLTGSGF
ncbi:leucine-rich PPR motif-containing protein, mitochondrial [Brachionichthys hirsutus]|uniref:leucine-rich PPR motif-containing protein, mitochondrial n=1 Tax=Brachionichthys hirsutus TaxID=412623 RepID=UPI003604CA07